MLCCTIAHCNFSRCVISIFICFIGEGHSIVLMESGEVFAFGKGEEGQLGLGRRVVDSYKPTKIIDLDHETVVAIAAGARSSFAVTASGLLYEWCARFIILLYHDCDRCRCIVYLIWISVCCSDFGTLLTDWLFIMHVYIIEGD
jgi:hypothetical protein